MAEREADRARPERLRLQAAAAQVSELRREVTPAFIRMLREHDTSPRLFGAGEIAAAAQSGFECAIARSLEARHGVDATDALCDAIRLRGEGYVREQKCQLVADCHPAATMAADSVERAWNEAILVAATVVLNGDRMPRTANRVRLDENLLARPNGGAGI
jgi:hypothetical protein